MAAPATPYAQANRQPGYSDQPAYGVPRDGRAPQPQARTAPAATTVEIGAYDNRFEPQTMNVAPGTTVRWTNRGQHAHTVTSSEGRWDSGDITPGATYAATFQQPGTYYYYCRHHQQDRMQGTIVVGGGGAAPSGRPGGAGTSGY
jgi:plastocyanin